MKLAFLVVLLAPGVAFGKPSKIKVPMAGNSDMELTFDPAKVSEADLRAAAQFAPESAPDGMTTGSLETCLDAAGASMPCNSTPHTPAQPAFFRDADKTIAQNRAIVAAAAARKAAPELEPAKEWLRRQLGFFAGLEERKLAYYKSWKVADLTPPIEGIDGAKKCAAIVAKLDAAASKDDKYKIVNREWHNCVNDFGHDLMGEYPKAPWAAYLKAHGVKAKFIPQEGD
jgi:hypothetical protein